MNTSRALFFAVAIMIVFVPLVSEAHRSGCHRWHSCPSDTGSYVCGDLGYTSGCPKKVVPKPVKKVAPVVVHPANSYVSGSTWYCNKGYKKSGSKCVVSK